MQVKLPSRGVWHPAHANAVVDLPPCRVPSSARYLDLEVELELSWAETGRYEHSALHYAVAGDAGDGRDSDNEGVLCLHVASVGRPVVVRTVVPLDWPGRTVRLRFCPTPQARTGRFRVLSARFQDHRVEGEEASRIARLEDLKDRVRRGVERSERQGFVVLDHAPQALKIELTARCNLTCPHCSSHGTPELHRRYNAMPEMSVEDFERLADEVFPSLTSVNLVGRGEPLLVSGSLWRAVTAKLREHHVRLALVTNATLVRKRLTEEFFPYLETVHVSVDGGTEETFAVNREGAKLQQAIDALYHLNYAARKAGQARRPRIGVTWTLKANNIDELPAFVERAIDIGVDQLTVRHLLVFHGKEREQSVVDRPDLVNEPLRRTYALLEKHGVRSDCPPLIEAAAQPPGVPVQLGERPPRDGCMFVRRTAVVHADGLIPTCPVPFAAAAGRLGEQSFLQIWNGPVLTEVRRSLDTPDEWQQCRHCWYREGRYESQRRSFDSRQERFDLSRPDKLTVQAWDFEDYTQ